MQKIEPETVSGQFVGEVEDVLGMGHGAWDTINPKDILAAAISLAPKYFPLQVAHLSDDWIQDEPLAYLIEAYNDDTTQYDIFKTIGQASTEAVDRETIAEVDGRPKEFPVYGLMAVDKKMDISPENAPVIPPPKKPIQKKYVYALCGQTSPLRMNGQPGPLRVLSIHETFDGADQATERAEWSTCQVLRVELGTPLSQLTSSRWNVVPQEIWGLGLPEGAIKP